MTFSTNQGNPAPLQPGSSSPLVKILKNYLRVLGHYPKQESSEQFDDDTAKAVMDFKKGIQGASADASVDNDVWNALIEKTSDIFLPTQTITKAIDTAISQAKATDGAITKAIDSTLTTAITTAKSTTVDPVTQKKGAIVEAIDSTLTTAITAAKSTTVDPVTQKKGAIIEAIDSTLTTAKSTTVDPVTQKKGAIIEAIDSAITTAKSTTVDPVTQKKGAIIEAIDSTLTTAITAAKSTTVDPVTQKKGAIIEAIDSAITTAKSTTVDPATNKKGAIVEAIDSAITTAKSTTVDPVTQKKGAIIEAIDSTLTTAITTAKSTTVDPATNKKGAIIEAIDSTLTTAITAAKSTTVDPATNKKGAIIEAIDSTLTTAINAATSTTVNSVTQKKGAIIEAIDSAITTAKSTTVDPVTQKKGAIIEAIDSAITTAKSTTVDPATNKKGAIVEAIDSTLTTAITAAKSTTVDPATNKKGAIVEAIEAAVNAAKVKVADAARASAAVVKAREYARLAKLEMAKAGTANSNIQRIATSIADLAAKLGDNSSLNVAKSKSLDWSRQAAEALTTLQGEITKINAAVQAAETQEAGGLPVEDTTKNPIDGAGKAKQAADAAQQDAIPKNPADVAAAQAELAKTAYDQVQQSAKTITDIEPQATQLRQQLQQLLTPTDDQEQPPIDPETWTSFEDLFMKHKKTLAEYDLVLIPLSPGQPFDPTSGQCQIAIAQKDQNTLYFYIFDDQGKKAINLPESDLATAKSGQLENLKRLLQPYWDSKASPIPPDIKKQIMDAVLVILSPDTTQDDTDVTDELNYPSWPTLEQMFLPTLARKR